MKRAFIIKVLKVVVFLLLVTIIMCNNVLAASTFVKDNFDGKIDSKAATSATTVQDVLITALTAVRIVGMAIAIIMLVVVGIKIMIASPSEKANVKQYTINYVIGAFILLSATGLLTIVKNVAMSSFDN